MTASQKAAISLLLTVLLFVAFAALAFAGLFDRIETRFYNPAVTTSMTREITHSANVIDDFFTELQTRFSQTLGDPAVQRSFLLNQSAEDIFERSRIYGLLHESLGGLQWVRFIDSGGLRIHFSTYAPDILAHEDDFLSYRNFNDPNIPYQTIAINYGGAPKIIFDEKGERILFSFPFYDYFELHRGTALFSLSVRTLSDILIREGRLNPSHTFSVVSNPSGFLASTPAAFIEEVLMSQVSSIWRDGTLNVATLYSPESGISLTLLTVRSSRGFFVGRLVNDDLFFFPPIMKIILLLSFFLTLYLTIFLFFNFRQDSMTVIQNRMKTLQISLIEQYYERKSDIDWERWSRELQLRREDISTELKRGIKISAGKKARDIDALVDKFWNELISVIGGFKETAIDEAKLRLILNRFLAAIPNTAASTQTSNISPVIAPLAETVEEIEELEAVEAAEDIEELETVDAEEDVTEAEPAEMLEELAVEEDEKDSPSPASNMERVASEIEFSPVPEAESSGDKEYIWEDFEVVSPFSDTQSDFSTLDNDDPALASAENSTAESEPEPSGRNT
ncbi:MAG: hypothetical protein FWB99_06815 [Treponema sp.]|nr:hypothetical protein [Treponema sp.]